MSRGAQDLHRRKYETEEEKEQLVPQLREVSRQEYLKKREEQQVAELEDALRDEELLFACVSPLCWPATAMANWPLPLLLHPTAGDNRMALHNSCVRCDGGRSHCSLLF